jgi:hypothetical protein
MKRFPNGSQTIIGTTLVALPAGCSPSGGVGPSARVKTLESARGGDLKKVAIQLTDAELSAEDQVEIDKMRAQIGLSE